MPRRVLSLNVGTAVEQSSLSRTPCPARDVSDLTLDVCVVEGLLQRPRATASALTSLLLIFHMAFFRANVAVLGWWLVCRKVRLVYNALIDAIPS